MMEKRILCMLICVVMLCSAPCSATNIGSMTIEELAPEEVQDELTFVLDYLNKLHQAKYFDNGFNVCSNTYVFLDDEAEKELVFNMYGDRAVFLIGLLPYRWGYTFDEYFGYFDDRGTHEMVERYPYYIRDKVSAIREIYRERNEKFGEAIPSGVLGEPYDTAIKRAGNGILYFNFFFNFNTVYSVAMCEYKGEYVILLVMNLYDGHDFLEDLSRITYDEWLDLRDEKQNGVAATEESDTSPTQAEPSTDAQMPLSVLEGSLAVAAVLELAVIVLLLRKKKDR